MSAKKNNKSKLAGLFFCIWCLIALIIVITFLVKKDDFISNLKETNFFERVVGSTPEFVENYQPKEEKPVSNGQLNVEVTPAPGKAETGGAGEYTLSANSTLEKADQTESVPEILQDTEEKPSQTETVQKEEEKPQTQTTNVKLCFVSIGTDGIVFRKQVTRAIPKSDAPLTNTIRALLEGPMGSDKGCMTLIPSGTRLLGATVKNGIAALNFSDDFEFNSYGADGYRAQLMQIVFTATEFSTVQSVQFLVEGQRKEYIGSGEDMWMWIGSPYSRSNF